MSDTTEKDKDLELLVEELIYKEKLLNITNSIHAAKNLDEILLYIPDQILKLFDADKLTMYAVDSNTNELFSKFKIGNEIGEIRVKIDKKSIAGFTAYAKTFINIEDAYNKAELSKIDPELSFNQNFDIQSGYRTKQVLASAILFRGEMLGVVQLINKKGGGPFGENEISSINEIANTLGIAFYNQSSRHQMKAPTKFSYLVKKNLITEQELNSIILKSRESQKGIIPILKKEFGIDKKEILYSLANFYNCPFTEFDPRIIIDKKLLRGLSADYFMKNLWTPFRQIKDTVEVLVDDPDNIHKLNEIKAFFKSSQIRLIGALPEDIIKYLQGIRKNFKKGAFRLHSFMSE
ncbi:MAG: GAF domain-containing protein [bacterium]